ncbi:sulfotransferase, partial [Candidatus Woesearchaeota archaeon]|nr:sulfotransferase [Candidatus Woesearchaeota archaeon]
MGKPNFFIVGAPKCGTTSLYNYLAEHNDIFLPSMKEPHYFTIDRPSKRRMTTLDEYLSLYNDVEPHHTAVGDASVSYLNSKIALESIKKFDNNAKIIVMLRNPVDLIYSQHSQLLFSVDENVKNFMVAYLLQDKRKAGKRIPKTCRDSSFLQYTERAQLGKQIQRLYNIFPKQWFAKINFVK